MSGEITKTLENIEKMLARLLEKRDGQIDISGLEDEKYHFGIYDSHAKNFKMRAMRVIPLELIKGCTRQKNLIHTNMAQYFQNLPANHVLLWGARGTGKSSLVKACFVSLLAKAEPPPLLLEVHCDDLADLSLLLHALESCARPIILFCDDISFALNDHSYRALKSILEGGLQDIDNQILFIATSNRRHLLEHHHDKGRDDSAFGQNSPHYRDNLEEQISLSDRFGLWIGFHSMDQEVYLEIIAAYFQHFGLTDGQHAQKHWQPHALEWAITRANRSGRTAWQFFKDYAGKGKIKISW